MAVLFNKQAEFITHCVPVLGTRDAGRSLRQATKLPSSRHKQSACVCVLAFQCPAKARVDIFFGEKLGAIKETFYGLAGLGDLILTATSLQSRNYCCGLNLAKKGEILKNETVEGIHTAFAVYHLAKKLRLKLPIIEGVYKIIYKSESPQKVLDKLKKIL